MEHCIILNIKILPLRSAFIYHPSNYGKSIFSIECIEINNMHPFKGKKLVLNIYCVFSLTGNFLFGELSFLHNFKNQ